VEEKGLRKDDGTPIPYSWVGLSEKCTFVRGSFSPEVRRYLTGLRGWFDHLEDFHHALAHRIPLYIPPFNLPPDKLAVYHDLEDRKREALKRQDFAEHERLED
jgi:hypothetical protein